MLPKLFLSFFCFTIPYICWAQAEVTNFNNAGAGSLRQAILDFNNGDESEIIFNVAEPGTITLESSLPVIIGSGQGFSLTGDDASSVTIDGDSAYSAFIIAEGLTATIDGSAGGLTISNCSITGNAGGSGGGAGGGSGGAGAGFFFLRTVVR